MAINNKTVLLVIAISVIVASLSLGLTMWFIGRLRQKSDQPLSCDMTGTVVVPVRQLMQSGWFSSKRNSLGPRLEIAPDGLHFKVMFAVAYWAFTDITRVDVPWVPFATRIAFRKRGGRLDADVAGQDQARELLRALPATLPFTPRAAALRDGTG